NRSTEWRVIIDSTINGSHANEKVEEPKYLSTYQRHRNPPADCFISSKVSPLSPAGTNGGHQKGIDTGKNFA
ncbi:unnamed protein product, partial [Ceratitis capitata]